jgi:cytochrome c oxidase subunit III
MKKTERSITEIVFSSRRGKPITFNQIFVYFSIAVIFMLFTSLVSAFLYSGFQSGFQPISLPGIFHANTIIILASSITFHYAIRAMHRDEENNFLLGVTITFLLGVSFIIFQFLGWHELSDRGIKMNAAPSGSFLYMISGVHALHLFAGIILVFVAWINAVIRYYDPVKELLFSTDSDKKHHVELIALYWHFVDVLWLALYLIFIAAFYLF